MALLQNKLNLRVSQKQILTPGLVQMVSVLALNKLELKDMITAEIVENPVLEELEESSVSLEEIARKEENVERTEVADEQVTQGDKNDPFDEIDFGSFFRDYLDPGHRTHSDIESLERPSFENFLSRPTTLTDHLMWQLGSLSVSKHVREAAERIIGNLNEDGYLTASDDELQGLVALKEPEKPAVPKKKRTPLADFAEIASEDNAEDLAAIDVEPAIAVEEVNVAELESDPEDYNDADPNSNAYHSESSALHLVSRNQPASIPTTPVVHAEIPAIRQVSSPATLVVSREVMQEALTLVQTMDPIGVAARDLRECLMLQLQHHLQLHQHAKGDAAANGSGEVLADAIAIVDSQLRPLQNKQYREIAKAIGRPLEAVMLAFDFIRTLDPKPGSRYNQTDARLIEPDVAFVKQGDEWLVMMNEDDVPQLRLNPTYKRLLHKETAEKDVRNYVKERYKSAIQLIKNIEQRKQTILKVCYSIIERQRDFLEHGIDHLKPMMIKEVAEEIGVHPSTVSRAVSSKYTHTPQGVFELRYFFSESVNGPEGGGTSLLILKRRVKKLIEEEDPAHPLTDDQITRVLQSQGIQVTRRTVAKYREDMRIPSTHQRRVKD
ncbi:MAG: rpoN [Candidatus Angelobacter sp.]|jgi:RNA polymerase sigma-54 factor|nr:rpoN [Candidatus Angelobacter sp.]